MTDVTMPRLSDTMQEGTIASWLKKPGDQVERGDVLAEVETDKATMDLTAFESGTLQEILAEAGTTVPIGQPVARIGTGGPPAAARSQPPASQAAPEADQTAAADQGTAAPDEATPAAGEGAAESGGAAGAEARAADADRVTA
ncbi:MAG: hypothetical protein JO023_23595, partial [Chloroflexi bacterium]|nr:hypothetical protein [Chloroflexota bacterium]